VTFSYRAGLVALTALLLGCTDGEVILDGVRQSPREAVIGEDAPGAEPLALGAGAAQPVAISLPAQQSNAEWSHRAGNAAHQPGNAAYSGNLTPVWSARIGQGDSRKNRISADPVVGAGRIYTLDSNSTVTATATSGATLWQADLTPAADRNGDASGGGLAFAEGRVFATTGFGELVALDAASGSIVWRQRFDVAVGGAPTVAGGQVYVVARDGSAWAIAAHDGRVVWQLPGAPTQAGVAGVSAPAVSGETVVFPFATGQLLGASTKDGSVTWVGFVAGKRLGRAYASVTDLTGDPVISGTTVYAGSASGRLLALDMKAGGLVWTANDGAESPVVVAGGAVFLVNDEDQLVRLDAGSGTEVWRIDLPYFTKDKDKRRKAIYAHYGPILAGGRLIVASSDGLIRAFDPASGKLIGQAAVSGGAASAPVVAGGTLYVVSKSGQLHAFR
jgi:outer membrane protein assembly factor BamB